LWINCLQLGQRLIESEQIHIALWRRGQFFYERDTRLGATSFRRLSRACVAHENASHHLRSDPEELCAILPVSLALIYQAQINFVHQRRRLQRMAGSLTAEEMHCLPVQFIIDKRQEFLERNGIAFARRDEPTRNLVSGGTGHLPLRLRRFDRR
jgi:hypothetical protein